MRISRALTVGFLVAAASPAQVDGEGYRLDARSAVYEAGPDPALDLSDEVTLEAWVKADRMPGGGGRILDKSTPGTSDGYMLDTYPGNSLRLTVLNGAVGHDAKLPGDRWTHVVGVYSASKRIEKLYVDGREAASRRDGAFPPLSKTGHPLRVGVDPDDGNRFMGRILRAAVYGRLGVSTHAFGSVCQWAVNLLNILTGNLDREGGVMFPEQLNYFKSGQLKGLVNGLSGCVELEWLMEKGIDAAGVVGGDAPGTPVAAAFKGAKNFDRGMAYYLALHSALTLLILAVAVGNVGMWLTNRSKKR